MLRIRCFRMGKVNSPFYRVVVAESFKARSGRYLDRIGTYNPLLKSGSKAVINEESYRLWRSRGAIPSDRVKRLVMALGIQP